MLRPHLPAPTHSTTHSSSVRYCCVCGARSSHLLLCVMGRPSLVASAVTCCAAGAAPPNSEAAGAAAPNVISAPVEAAPNMEGVEAAPNSEADEAAPNREGVEAAPKSEGVEAGPPNSDADDAAPNAGVATPPPKGEGAAPKAGVDAAPNVVAALLAAPKSDGVEAAPKPEVEAAPKAGVLLPLNENMAMGWLGGVLVQRERTEADQERQPRLASPTGLRGLPVPPRRCCDRLANGLAGRAPGASCGRVQAGVERRHSSVREKIEERAMDGLQCATVSLHGGRQPPPLGRVAQRLSKLWT